MEGVYQPDGSRSSTFGKQEYRCPKPCHSAFCVGTDQIRMNDTDLPRFGIPVSPASRKCKGKLVAGKRTVYANVTY
jgi:hypothetical protein